MKLRTKLSLSAMLEKARMPPTARLAIPFVALLSFPAFAADIDGAWVANPSYCNKVFVKNGNKVSFTSDADFYGGSFIVEGTRAYGTFQKCKITSTKNDGKITHVIAACSDGVMVQEMQFTVKFVDADRITLTLIGSENEENPFVRCPF